MEQASPLHLQPRKRPRQARSTVTLDAIFEATIQVLLAGGLQRLTTTRVAERAGISVGTMYQYFPHKQALLYAVNEHYLSEVAAAVEAGCEDLRGASVAEMIEGLVPAYWNAKAGRGDVTRAIYMSTVELDNEGLIKAFTRRIERATIAMFDTAPDAGYADPGVVIGTLLSVVFGTVRTIFERDLPAPLQAEMRGQLVVMCVAYAKAARRTGADWNPTPVPA